MARAGWLTVVAAAFEFVPRLLEVPAYIFPRLSLVLGEYVVEPGYLLGNAAVTLLEGLLGLAVAALIGVALGVAASRSDAIAGATRRFAVILQTVPIVAVAPLIVIWTGPDLTSKVLMASLIAVPPMIVAAVEGFRAAPPDLLAALRIMGAEERVVTRHVRVPFALSHLSVGLRLSAALSVIGAIVAEYAGSTRGIGYVIMQASYRLDTAVMFAAVLSAIGCGLLLVQAVGWFSGAVLRLVAGEA